VFEVHVVIYDTCVIESQDTSFSTSRSTDRVVEAFQTGGIASFDAVAAYSAQALLSRRKSNLGIQI
jgi:hypothetical protein